MNLAPILLFVYNRPEHTQLTVEALQKNLLASSSDLYVYSDAPKTELQQDSVERVRELIHGIEGFNSVTIIERDENKGLAESIVDGVDSLINKFGKVIVLEDDLVTSPYFLSYMNDALQTYENSNQVMHVSGYCFPFNNKGLPETFFLRVSTCWGWATWASSWRYFKKDTSIMKQFDMNMINSFNFSGTYDYFSHLELNQKGEINTWAIFWYASVFLRGGLCLHPANSLVNNVGNDNSGVHSIKSGIYDVNLVHNPVSYFEKELVENDDATNRLISFYKTSKPSFLTRVKNKINILMK